MLVPVVSQNSASTLSIFYRAIISPRMDLKNARPFRATISEKLVRPPAFKISTAPNCEVLYLRKFQGAIHPSAAAPFRRAHVPVRVIVEGDNGDRLGDTPNPERSQIMKIRSEERRVGKECRCWWWSVTDKK